MDLRTLFLAQTGALVATAAMLWVARADADRRNGLRTWTFAITSQGIAYLLLANAGRLPVLLSAVAGNALGAASVALFMVAIREFLGRSFSVPWLAAMVVVITAVAGAAGANYELATIFNGFVYGGIQLLNGRALWQRPANGLRRVQRVVALFYLLMGLVLPARALALLVAGVRQDYLDMPLDWQAPLYVFGFLYIIVTNLGFLLMCKTRAEAEVRLQAMTDDLTGLANRRALDEAIEDALARAVGSGQPFAVVMADLDHFKAINDRFGHHAGDEALAAFARRLRSGLRADDRGFRYGGEEFCVLMPRTDGGSALALADALRRHVSLPPEADRRGLSASFGVAVWRTGDTVDSMFHRADQALYRAKVQGRDRVEMG